MPNKLDNTHLFPLCDFQDNKYISKSGKEYIDALKQVFILDNRNDIPFLKEDVIQQPTLQEFSFIGKNDYQFICKLKAQPMTIDLNKTDNKTKGRKNEKIIAYDFVDNKTENIFNQSLGVSYLITAIIDNKEHIIKIGETRTTFKQRLGSYNCGVVYNWRTASTTNIKMLQSMLATRLEYNLYLYDCSDEPYILTWHGEKSVPFASPKALAVEDIMIKKFKEQFGKTPLANIQSNATEI